MRAPAILLAILMILSPLFGGAATAVSADKPPTETVTAAAAAEDRFVPDRFTFSGGTGRVTITCPEVKMEGDQAWATLVLSSPNYPYVKVDGVRYDAEHPDGSSVVTVPVELNAPVEIVGMTTAMSQPHEITYTICVYRSAGAELIPGLTFAAREETGAELMDILRYEDGYFLVCVSGVGRYLVVPAGGEVPAPLEEDIQVIRQPAENVYVASEELFDALAALDDGAVRERLTLTGFESAAAGTVFLGQGRELALAQLLRHGCSLALLPPLWADGRVTGRETGAEETVVRESLGDDEAEELHLIFQALREFGIAAFVDRSGDEPTEQGREAWLTLYAELLGRAAPETPEESA